MGKRGFAKVAAGSSARLKRVNRTLAIVNGCLFLLFVMGAAAPREFFAIFQKPDFQDRFRGSKISTSDAIARARAQKDTRLIRLDIRIRPEPDSDILKVREEYLLAHYGAKMKRGFTRTWKAFEPMLTGDNHWSRGPAVTYEITSATRQWLPEERAGTWLPLLDSNDRSGLPPLIEIETTLKTSGTFQTLAMSNESDLDHGVYAYKLEYLIRGALFLDRGAAWEGFLFTAIRPTTATVDSLTVQVDVPSDVRPESGVIETILMKAGGPTGKEFEAAAQHVGKVIQVEPSEGGGQLLAAVASQLQPLEGIQVKAYWALPRPASK